MTGVPPADRRPRVRRATYRVQFQPDFGFADGAAIADYLARLGVSHLYASPSQEAAAGSTHGYDVVDHGRLREELGGDDAHARLVAALADQGLGQLLDIVPNHMAIGDRRNRWWWDVLEDGPASLYAGHFDIDWDPPESRLRNQILVPILGDHYGLVLEAGDIHLAREPDGLVVRYHEHMLPLAAATTAELLEAAGENPGGEALRRLAAEFSRIAGAAANDRAARRARYVARRRAARELEQACRDDRVAGALDAVLTRRSGDHEALHAVLEGQHYRLAYWRAATRDISYRRFFDINTLAALRTERPEVFADTHELVLEMMALGHIDGLRVDHLDGFADPEGYLGRLAEATNRGWVVVEKILEPGESLPDRWPVAGTTGYEAGARIGGLFVDPLGEMPLTTSYQRFTGVTDDFAAVAHGAKHQVMRDVLASDVNRLTERALRVCEGHPRYRDYSRHEVHETLRELIAALPVYRTYARCGSPSPRPEDERYLGAAAAQTTARRPDLDPALVEFLVAVVLGRVSGEREADFARRFQQASGPVMAKGVEDTAFYTYLRLTALNEVGSSPGHFGVAVEEFHRASAEAAARWPEGLVATSTHDSKRSEDVRARLALLSEIPEAWDHALAAWHERTTAHRSELVDRNTEWLFYQTAVGAWPITAERLKAYMEKATREAKVHTSWTEPRPAYDEAIAGFVSAALADEAFTASMAEFVAPLIRPGRINALAQTALKLFSPGVADFYQGSELWTDSLVDPDNRRPVDYALRRRMLDALPESGGAREAWARDDEGSAKLLLIARGLALRRRVEPLGDYRPLWAAGPAADRVVAFAREPSVVVAVPRLILGLERRGGWGETVLALPPGVWRDALTGATREGSAPLGELFGDFPVALLEAQR